MRLKSIGRLRSIAAAAAVSAAFAVSPLALHIGPVHAEAVPSLGAIPSLIGTWSGKVDTISDKKGLVTRDRTVHITEQTDRRFRGYFTYEAGRKDFFGVIYPDNISFTWVAPNSRGYNHGRILSAGRISACYVESWEEATAGCADLAKTSDVPQREPRPDAQPQTQSAPAAK